MSTATPEAVAPEPLPLFKYRCPKCHKDENVGFDATSSFDLVTQNWELDGHYDQAWCNDCGEVDELVKVELEGEELAETIELRRDWHQRQHGVGLYKLLSEVVGMQASHKEILAANNFSSPILDDFFNRASAFLKQVESEP